jgi:deoxyhypusine synthase
VTSPAYSHLLELARKATPRGVMSLYFWIHEDGVGDYIDASSPDIIEDIIKELGKTKKAAESLSIELAKERQLRNEQVRGLQEALFEKDRATKEVIEQALISYKDVSEKLCKAEQALRSLQPIDAALAESITNDQ